MSKMWRLIKPTILYTVICLNFCMPVFAKHEFPEKYYQQQWCTTWHGTMEYKLNDRCRVDCLTKNYAVEFDFAPKWAEAVGQSLYYAKKTGKKPAIILIIEKPSDFKYFKRAELLAKEYGIKLWYMKPPTKVSYTNIQNIDNIQKNIYKFLNSLKL